MKTFIEWCKDRGLSLESCHKEPVRSGKKVSPHPDGSAKAPRKMADDLSKDYKGHYATNGTVDPLHTVGKGGGTGAAKKAVADVAK